MRTRAAVLFTLFFLMRAATADALGGRLETKRERMEKEQKGLDLSAKRQEPATRAIYEAYLNENFSEAEVLCSQALKTRKSDAEAEELSYMEALCLLKMHRTDEARRMLGGITASSSPLRAEAALSFADSFVVDGDAQRADTEYRRVLAEYGETDVAGYARSRLTASENGIGGPSGFFTVQVGSFSNESNARSLISKLLETRYEAYLENGQADRLYRVRVGRFHSQEDARALEARLKKDGYPTKFVSEPIS